MDNISVYFGRLAALYQVSFSVSPGERRCIIGPNGAGKTTLFNVICGFLRPSVGDIYIFGKKTTTMSPYKHVNMGLARTFQRTSIFLNLSILDNLFLALGQKAFGFQRFKMEERSMQKKAESFLEQFNLHEKKHLLASALSYGEQRILEVALAMALRARNALL